MVIAVRAHQIGVVHVYQVKRRTTGQVFALKLIKLPEDEDDRNQVSASIYNPRAEVVREMCRSHREISHVDITCVVDGGATQVMAEAVAEIELLRDISHANITRFYNAWKQDSDEWAPGKLAILMEYADGGSLQALIKKQRPGPGFIADKVRTLFAQLVAAFEHLHSGTAVHSQPNTTVLHRDIKPENILVTQDDRVKVRRHL